MATKNSADVVIVGTGVVGVVIAEQLLDAGHSVLMIEAGPRVTRAEVVENFRTPHSVSKATHPLPIHRVPGHPIQPAEKSRKMPIFN